MSEISEPSSGASIKPNTIVLTRILVIKSVLLVSAIIASLFLYDRLVTAGLIAGGFLSFVNFYWLKASLAGILGAAASGVVEPKALTFLKFNLRFIALIMAILALYLSEIVSVPALFAGLLSLAAAVTIEGFIQLFLAVFRREEV